MSIKKHFWKVLTVVLALVMFMSVIPAQAVTVTPDISYRFYMVGNSHIDTAWRWPIQHTAEVVIYDTFNRQVNALKTNSTYRFTASCATHYIWAKEYYPTIYADIKALFAKGQWGLAGGQMVEPDLNVMEGEAFARHGLYAQHFFLEEFGQIARIALVPDVFGFSGQFPQFIRKTGMNAYVATKMNWSSDPADGALDPGPWSQSSNGQNSKGRESDIFWWEALDGTDVLSYNCYNDYTSSYVVGDFRDSSNNVFNRIARSGSFTLSSQPVYGSGTYYYDYDSNLKYALGMFGSGDHGGGPNTGTSLGTHGGPAANSGPATTAGRPTVLPATLEEYFDAVRIPGVGTGEIATGTSGANRDSALGSGLSKVYRHVGENYLSYHRGTYTSWSRVKKYNRQLNTLAQESESAATLAFWTKTIENNSNEKIAIAWDRILVNTMHDILPGSSSPPEYYQAFMGYELSKNLYTNVLNNSLLALAYRADTSVDEGVPVFVYNALNWQRDGQTTTTVTLDKQYPYIKVFDGTIEVPVSVIENRSTGVAKISFLAKGVPSLGYKVFKVVGSNTPSTLTTDVRVVTNNASSIVVENDSLQFTISKATGNMPSLINKKDGNREVFYQTSALQGNELQFKTDTGGSSYPAWDMTNSEFGGVTQSFTNVRVPAATPQIVVNTPERVTIKVVHSITDSSNTTPSIATRYITLLAGSDRIDVHFELDWQMYQRNLKLAFPVHVDARGSSYEIAYGAMDGAQEVKRQDAVIPSSTAANPLMANTLTGTPAYAGAIGRSTIRDTRWNSARFEQSGHKWMDVTNDAGTFGMSILNNAKYGYDVLKMVRSGSSTAGTGTDSNITGSDTYVRTRMTIVRSPNSANNDYESTKYQPSNQIIDIGYQEFDYAIYPHAGTWQDANTSREAHEVNYAMPSFQAVPSAGDGILGKEKSFLSTNKPNVTIGALKNMHDDQTNRDALIVRLWETNGANTSGVVLTLPSNVISAREVNMLEHDYNELSDENVDSPISKELKAKPVAVSGNTVTFDIGHYEVLTLEIKIAPYGGTAVPLTQQAVSLASFFNLKGTSSEADRKGGNIDGAGNSIPEMLWATAHTKGVDYQGIKFSLAAENANNFVTAQGQTIPVNAAGFNRIYLLGVGAGSAAKGGKFIVNYSDSSTAEKELTFAVWNSPLTGWAPLDKMDTNPYVYDSIAHVFTHWHDGTADQMTRDNFLYAYYIDLDVTKTISSITLPDAAGAKLAAVTLINSPIAGFGHTNENFIEPVEEYYSDFSELFTGAIGSNIEKQGIAGAVEATGHRAFSSLNSAGTTTTGTEGASQIVTNNGSSKWCNTSTTSSNAWFILDAGSSVNFPGYVIRGANDDMSYTARVLHTWTVQGGDSASGPWTTISSPSGQGSGWTSNYQTRMYLFDNGSIPAAGFRYYRLQIVRIGTSSAGTALGTSGTTVQFSYFGLVTSYAENGALDAKVEKGITKVGNVVTVGTANGQNAITFIGNVANTATPPVSAKSASSIKKGLNVKVFTDTKFGYMIKPKDSVGANMVLNLGFSDGTRLSALNAVDQNGIAMNAKAQGAGGKLIPGQWNYVEVDLGKFAVNKIINEIIISFDIDGATPGAAIEASIDSIMVYRGTPAPVDVKVYAALYNAAGKMVDISVSDTVKTQAFDNVAFLKPSIILDASTAGNGCYTKVFAWTVDGLIPVKEADYVAF